MPAGRPPIPLERQAAQARGDGRRPDGRRPGAEIATTAGRVITGRVIDIPAAPDGLRERGLREWDKIWEAGIIWLHPAEDYHWVEQIARAYDDLEAFRDEVNKTGLVVKGYVKGMVVANPLLKEMRMLEATIRKCLSQLGFSPADRARLGLVEVKTRTGIADLQNKTRANRSKDGASK